MQKCLFYQHTYHLLCEGLRSTKYTILQTKTCEFSTWLAWAGHLFHLGFQIQWAYKKWTRKKRIFTFENVFALMLWSYMSSIGYDLNLRAKKNLRCSPCWTDGFIQNTLIVFSIQIWSMLPESSYLVLIWIIKSINRA